MVLAGCASNIVPPILLTSGQLEYPSGPKESSTEGYVIVSYDVTQSGDVINLKIIESSPPSVFDEAAVEYVKTWHFQAKQVDGQKVSATGLQSRISFLLDSGEASYTDFLK